MSKQKCLFTKQLVFFITFTIMPRLLRFFHPRVNLEDSSYLDAISCMSRGEKPHVDFVYTHIPFPEILITLLYKLFGTAYRITEIFSAVAVTVTALLIFVVGDRIKSKRAGIISALFYAWHPLIFNYHLFEKEIYEALFACLLGVLFLGVGKPSLEKNISKAPSKTFIDREVFEIAGLLFLGYLTKLDFSFLVGGILLYLALVEKEFVRAVVIFFIFNLLVTLHTILSFHFFGWEFLRQIYLFHFLKGSETSQGIKLLKWLMGGGYLFVPAVFSFLFLKNISSRQRWYLISWTLAPLLFFSVVTDTLWFHNVINLLPPLSVLAGVYVDEVIGFFRTNSIIPHENVLGKNKGIRYLILFSLVLWAIAVFLYIMWLGKINFGFQGTPRREIESVSKIVEKKVAPDALIIAPAIISAQTNRKELLHNREVAPVYRLVMKRVEEIGFIYARKEISAVHFRVLSEKARHLWVEEINEKIATASVPMVVGELVPNYYSFNPNAEYMKSYGYREVYRGCHYVVWLKE